jgi:hypothetical protein
VLREIRKGWLVLSRIKSVEGAQRLPGITIGTIRHARALQGARFPWLSKCPNLSAYERPQLRLIVDNARRVGSPSAYTIAATKRWLTEVCANMA